MAATDVLPSSPLTPGQAVPWSSFDDYLDFPSPLATPRLAPAAAPVLSQTTMPASTPSGSTPMQGVQSGNGLSSSAATSSSAPPPPGSSPEVLFRYYLAAELRRMGSSADDAIIDRYVAQHYDSFTKAMDRQQGQTSEPSKLSVPSAAAADPARLISTSSIPQVSYQSQANANNGVSAFRSPPPMAASSPTYLLNSADAAGQSIDPHLMELSSVHQPFTVSRLPSTEVRKDAPTASSPASKGKYRESSAGDEDEDMSEDDEDEDDKDKLAGLVDRLKTSPASSRTSKVGVGSIEETPIAGSIMGPANELRPDPEAYRKLSSKEKRQLRNKISARNFRTRRKEHIAHLEQQVADRDTVIEGLRQQLSLVKVQNKDLADEVRVLKSKSISNADVNRIIEALQKGSPATATSSSTDMGPPTSLLRSSSNSSLNETFNGSGRPTTPASPRSNSPRPLLTRPNMRKDLPISSNGSSSKPFWGGVGGSGNNFMSVHTVLVPNVMSTAAHRYSSLDEKMSSLTRLVDEKLTMGDAKKEEKKQRDNKTVTDAMQESDVNEAIVSLLGNDDVPPPCYAEATGVQAASAGSAASGEHFGDESVHPGILAALAKALSSSASGSGKGGASPRLDSRKLQALLDGRASLILFDEEKGQAWSDESETERQGSWAHCPTVLPASATSV